MLADERNLGGAHMIQQDYAGLSRRRDGATVTRAILESKKTSEKSMAQRLSHNRAVRRASVNMSGYEHINNIYHLNRRIESLYSETERKKNPWDPTVYPSLQKGSPALPDLHQSLMPWAPGAASAQQRPRSTPRNRPTSVPADRSRKELPDTYAGWSLTKSLRAAFPSDDFPLLQSATQQRLDEEYTVYKKAMMQEIVGSRMYRERDLRKLFRSYQQLAPLHDKQVVDEVVADLKAELDVA